MAERKTPPNYEVGFGKPPKHTRFKSGQSGNPGGRSKKKPTLEESLRAEMAKVVTITLDGKPAKLTQGEVVLKTLMRKAMNGDLAAARVVLQSWQSLPMIAEAAAKITIDELQLLREMLVAEEPGSAAQGPQAGP